MAFMVWLFKAFFRVRWSQTSPSDQASPAASLGVGQLRFDEGHHESELTAFLASLAEAKDRYLSYDPGKDGFQLFFNRADGYRKFSGGGPTHREFLAAVASSKVASCESIFIGGSFCRCNLKQLEEIVRALVPNSNFTKVMFNMSGCTTLQMSGCVSNLLSGNKAIEHLEVVTNFREVVGKEAAELVANGLRENRALKKLDMWRLYDSLVVDEAMEELTKPLKENDSVLQELKVGQVTDVGLEHLGAMLGTNTSLKRLTYSRPRMVGYSTRSDEVYMRGYTSLSVALCVNRSLEALACVIASSMELKVLLQPLMPTNNKPEANITLTDLSLNRSRIGGKEGVDILVDMIRTNTSLLRLDFWQMTELSDSDPDAVENAVAILEALKTNKSLKVVSFGGCTGVGGYKVLGTMMDLLSENRQLELYLQNDELEETELRSAGLESSGDARYFLSKLEVRKKVKLWDWIKGQANVSPKLGRIFLCGNLYARK
ncbi:hypothetical protein KC19_2G116100 [Ceratodon purpureus]|uniref:Uncharacterized protein n=1 Tax=Ceratodon purpureus TaxID=3225 RepID=A0A8T0IUJ7_CERPU|nr:hypothetical protein KC19_2G116100 [Ceratodon purpureus]